MLFLLLNNFGGKLVFPFPLAFPFYILVLSSDLVNGRTDTGQGLTSKVLKVAE